MSLRTPIQPACCLYFLLLLLGRLLAIIVIIIITIPSIIATDFGIHQRSQCSALQCSNIFFIDSIVRIQSGLYHNTIGSRFVCPTKHLVGTVASWEINLPVVVRVENVLTGLAITPSSWLYSDAVVGVAADHQGELFDGLQDSFQFVEYGFIEVGVHFDYPKEWRIHVVCVCVMLCIQRIDLFLPFGMSVHLRKRSVIENCLLH
mmetsp:Transcript_37369/g.67198  ORF Transcript_37369/g.67198 Transcript_37369/m.67198 type:complete len:204 (+) Transcript_37369:660-1271(+)